MEFLAKEGASLYYLDHGKDAGMGCFLNPPNNPEHTYSIVEKRGGHVTGLYSLSGAIKTEWIPYKVQLRCKRLLKKVGEISEEWIQSCYNYFRSCYSLDGINRNVSDYIRIPYRKGEYFLRGNPYHHLAYLHIKKFFPEYPPRLDLIINNGHLGSWSKE